MNKLKNLTYRFFILFTSIVMVISFISCVEDKQDKDLISIQTFIERYDRTTWTVIEEEMRVYLKINDNMDKALELWMSDLELAKLMVHKECFYHSYEMLNTKEVAILENSSDKLEFTYLDDKTYTFSMNRDRLKLEFKTSDKVREPVYFSKTTENVTELTICSEESSKGNFDWRFLK